jgi:hypothetical protein
LFTNALISTRGCQFVLLVLTAISSIKKTSKIIRLKVAIAITDPIKMRGTALRKSFSLKNGKNVNQNENLKKLVFLV